MLYAIVALLAVIVDQWVKYWVAGNIPLESTVNELIPGVISVVNVHNSGAAFGFLSGGGARIPFIIICGVFTVAIIIALATNFISNPLGRWSAVFVMAGGIGNCIDRILYGYVQDMFMFNFAPSFPIFNVADIFITVFALLFIVMLLAFLICVIFTLSAASRTYRAYADAGLPSDYAPRLRYADRLRASASVYFSLPFLLCTLLFAAVMILEMR